MLYWAKIWSQKQINKEIRNRISKTFRQRRLRRSTSPFDRKGNRQINKQTEGFLIPLLIIIITPYVPIFLHDMYLILMPIVPLI